MKQNKLGTFDLTQIAGGPLGNFAQQAPTWKKGGAAAEVIEIIYIYVKIVEYIYIYVCNMYIYIYMNYDKYIFICIFMILVHHLYTIYVYHLQKIIQK